MSALYINPIGEASDISYNSIQKLKINRNTIAGRLESTDAYLKSDQARMITWSIAGSFAIIAFMVLLRNIRE